MIAIISLILTLSLLTPWVHASTYHYQGKEITKGQAILALAKDPKAIVIKQDQVELNMEKGTLRNKKLSK